MRRLLIACLLMFTAGTAAAQTAGDAPLGTRNGHEFTIGVGHYDYIEPGTLRISIHGPRLAGDYTATRVLDQRKRWFAQANVRGSAGRVTYDGWCLPYMLRPDSRSPNGYALGFGDASPCSDTDDPDWYVEARGFVGKDFLSRDWGFSPETGVAVRYLSNGTVGNAGYRTDRYLYVPIGLTARRNVTAERTLSIRAEYDVLLRGWQTTRHSKLGGGEVPATAAAPAFTIERFSDLSFDQHRGWAARIGATYQVTRRWSVEPSFIRWHVSDSSVSSGTVTFTVNNITVDQQLRAYEPDNVTNELSVSLGFHF